MSKFVIFVLGLVFGVLIVVTAMLKKGCDNMKQAYVIDIEQDEELNVWVAKSSGDTSLVLESKSLDELIEQVRLAVPKLLKVNNIQTEGNIQLYFRIHEHIRELVSA
jgi:hypothetical protein